MIRDYTQATQAYSTWGDKLLQHCDRLSEIQRDRRFRPITLQLAPTEVCDSGCSFCSVANRPSGKIPLSDIVRGVSAFTELGCKSVELTGGGNPTLYRDGKWTLNNVIKICHAHSLEIGLITNSENLLRHLREDSLARCAWVRVSLAKLDEGKSPADYDLCGIDESKLGFSYIVNNATTEATFHDIQRLLDRYPKARFARIAPDCLNDDALLIKHKWGPLLTRLDPRFFIKEIEENYKPFAGGCWVGMLRPYWTSTGIYICTSHVLKKRTYLPEYRLCGLGEISETWERMNAHFATSKPPYNIDVSQCGHCYYSNNNQLLSTVINELPDKNFA